ncbi:MAG: NFACT RNA binding domain-containing protein [Armatimonadota bacterium]|nr:NFACT RNA binding domain-containing protein [Armatimonadota bacterium]
MIVDSTCLAGLVAEAREYASGLVIRRIVQPRHHLVALELGRAGPWACLVIDWSAEFGRLHLAREMPQPGLQDQRFGSTLRRQLRGARIEAIRQVDFDRLVRVEVSNCEQLGPQSRRTLVAELMGRHSNLVLIDEDERIVEAGKHVTERVNRYRQTLPGLAYVPPPEFGRVPPWEADPEEMAESARAVADQPLGRWLRSTFHGGSDLFLREVCARAGLDPESALRDLPDGWSETVAEQLHAIPERAAAPGGAWIYFDESGEHGEFAYPIELRHLPGRRHEPVESLSAAVEDLQSQIAGRQRIRQLRERLLAAVRDAESKVGRTLERRREAVERAKEAQLHRERGELLMTYQHRVPEGAEEVALPRFDGEGELTIPLDPGRTPVENAQAYFRRYKKAERLTEVAPKLLAAARHELRYLRQVHTQIEVAEELADLELIEEELIEEDYLAPRKGERARPEQRRRGPRTTRTSDGIPLLYGKSGMENDEVLCAANPDDLWFHVKDAAGPHVVLRSDSRPEELPQSSVEEAARLAAALSSRRRDSKVEVDCTLAKNVNKPRGGRPGLAYYHADRTLVVDLRSGRTPRR